MPRFLSNFSALTAAAKTAMVTLLLIASPAFALDVNKASVEELQTVEGIGPVIAKRIVTERRNGKFSSSEDLIARVKGVGDKTAKKITSGSGLKRGTRSSSSRASSSKKSSSSSSSKSSTSASKSGKATTTSKTAKSSSDKKATSKKSTTKTASTKSTTKTKTQKKSTKKSTKKKPTKKKSAKKKKTTKKKSS